MFLYDCLSIISTEDYIQWNNLCQEQKLSHKHLAIRIFFSMHKKILLSYLMFLQRNYRQICHQSKFPSIVFWESSYNFLTVCFGLQVHLLSFSRTSLSVYKNCICIFLAREHRFLPDWNLVRILSYHNGTRIFIELLTSIHPWGPSVTHDLAPLTSFLN